MSGLDSRERLSERAQVYVTLAAARSYASARNLGEEEARRELTELLLDAHRVGADEGPREAQAWRYRSRARGVDVSARIVMEGPLAVVVACSARRQRSGR